MRGFAKPLVLAQITGELITTAEIAERINFSGQAVRWVLVRELRNGYVVREPMTPEGKRWVYGWRLRCRSCGK